MQIPPVFSVSQKMITTLAKIESNRTYIQTLSVPDKIVTNLTHQSLLKSSVFSAQIEGNTLSLEDIENKSEKETKQFERQEIMNIISALSYMKEKGIPELIDIPYLLQLHRLVMHKLIHPSKTGLLRNQPSAIFDSFGNVIYMTPPPSELNNLLIDLLHIVNNKNDIFPLIKAPLAHVIFEKIHPFMDGNGRIGRLLFQGILVQHNYHFNWLLPIEELLQQKKQTYYALLDQNDATEFINFMLEIMFEESERLKNHLDSTSKLSEEDFLLPRRKEILNIINDQNSVSFDQVQRRFLKVPGRTLRYDIKQLEKQGLIRKIGTTRGAMYQRIK